MKKWQWIIYWLVIFCAIFYWYIIYPRIVQQETFLESDSLNLPDGKEIILIKPNSKIGLLVNSTGSTIEVSIYTLVLDGTPIATFNATWDTIWLFTKDSTYIIPKPQRRE